QLMAERAFAWHGPGIQALAIDPATPTTVYAATEPATLFKSANGGTTWSGSALPTTGHVPAVAIDPLTPATLYVAGDSGVLKSTDSGSTWAITSLTETVAVLAIDPITAATIYAARSADTTGQTHSGLFKSIDGGVTWQALD